MKYVHDISRIFAIAKYAISNGAVLSTPQSLLWDCSGGCDNPRLVTLEGRTPRDLTTFFEWCGKFRNLTCPPADTDFKRLNKDIFCSKPDTSGRVFWIDILVKCRVCEQCLRKRAAMWYYRAKNEYACSSRTWFGTLTLSPEWHYYVECQATKDSGYWCLDELGQLRQRHKVISCEITRYLKRVRKECAVPFRFLLVLEVHKSGLPHYHLLIHERNIEECVRKRTLQEQWKWGFTNFKICEDCNSAAYVAKYLSKSMLCRVRASIGYGDAISSLTPVRQKQAAANRSACCESAPLPEQGSDCPF